MHDGLWLWTYDIGFVYIGDITSLKALSFKKDTSQGHVFGSLGMANFCMTSILFLLQTRAKPE